MDTLIMIISLSFLLFVFLLLLSFLYHLGIWYLIGFIGLAILGLIICMIKLSRNSTQNYYPLFDDDSNLNKDEDIIPDKLEINIKIDFELPDEHSTKKDNN